jgi:hypothetical protein
VIFKRNDWFCLKISMDKNLEENDVIYVKMKVDEFSKWKKLNKLKFIVMEKDKFDYV